MTNTDLELLALGETIGAQDPSARTAQASLVYLDQNGLIRTPTAVEAFTGRIFANFDEKIAGYNQIDQNPNYEELFPSDLGQVSRSITRYYDRIGDTLSLRKIDFGHELVNFAFGVNSNDRISSDNLGVLHRIGSADIDTFNFEQVEKPFPRRTRALLVYSLGKLSVTTRSAAK